MSLTEQRSAIERYAVKSGLSIISWYEEQETAAKRGRPQFSAMLRLLSSGKALGVIIHKIDRSARNLRDWADLGELIDRGIEIHFANEGLDLRSRGGRLSADIQAVIAADYIRNLREEIRKGFYGRLKQGVLPLPAPVGYLNAGGGKPKTIDPHKGPLIRHIFDYYSAGTRNLRATVDEARRIGLTGRSGARLGKTAISKIFNNPFYYGVIRLRKSKEAFPGAHQPLISKALYDRVQLILKGKFNTRSEKHDFVFRRLFRCGSCSLTLIGETKKGHVYYRCQNADCHETAVREEVVAASVDALLIKIALQPELVSWLVAAHATRSSEQASHRGIGTKALELQAQQLADRRRRLLDAYVDHHISKEDYESRNMSLVNEIAEIEERKQALLTPTSSPVMSLKDYLGLAQSLKNLYGLAPKEVKREIIRLVTSDRLVTAKEPYLATRSPFTELINLREVQCGGPQRDTARIERVIQYTINAFEQMDEKSQEKLQKLVTPDVHSDQS